MARAVRIPSPRHSVLVTARPQNERFRALCENDAEYVQYEGAHGCELLRSWRTGTSFRCFVDMTCWTLHSRNNSLSGSVFKSVWIAGIRSTRFVNASCSATLEIDVDPDRPSLQIFDTSAGGFGCSQNRDVKLELESDRLGKYSRAVRRRRNVVSP